MPALNVRLALASLAAIAFGTPLHAHDFWIEPSTFRPEIGSVLKVGLRVGEGFRGDPVPRDPRRIARFVIAGPAGERDVLGLRGAEPAGTAPVPGPGLHIIGYRSKHSSVTLRPKEFEKYLAEEGLERIVALRAQRQESGAPGREIFSRCAKSLVAAGPEPMTGNDRPLGFTLELIAESNPYALKAGQELPVRILYQGQPLEGALVLALPHNKPAEKLSAHSDRDGRVTFKLPAGGAWLVKAVHMVPAPAGGAADWESLWASLTFELPRP